MPFFQMHSVFSTDGFISCAFSLPSAQRRTPKQRRKEEKNTPPVRGQNWERQKNRATFPYAQIILYVIISFYYHLHYYAFLGQQMHNSCINRGRTGVDTAACAYITVDDDVNDACVVDVSSISWTRKNNRSTAGRSRAWGKQILQLKTHRRTRSKAPARLGRMANTSSGSSNAARNADAQRHPSPVRSAVLIKTDNPHDTHIKKLMLLLL